MKLISLFSLLMIANVFVPCTFAYKILLLAPFPGKSHWLMLEHIIVQLLHREHEVTAITNFKLKTSHDNYTEILIDPPFSTESQMSMKDIYENNNKSDFLNILILWLIGLSTSKYGLEDRKVQALITSQHLEFDLIIGEHFVQESWLMFAHKYKAPIVTICTFGMTDYIDRVQGLLTPWSHVPHMVVPYTDDMSFWQRCYNVILSATDMIFRRFYYLPAQDRIASQMFSHLEATGPLPSVLDLEKNISIILVNSHRSISSPRPKMPTTIEIGGLHIVRTPSALPENIQSFLDGATDGVIYFSFGTHVRSSDMPKEKMNIFLDVFSTLKQRVLWKWEKDDIPNLPSNVMVQKWMPQNDVLAHKNIILFITHGGLFGTQEAIYRGVPLLFMPFFGDQKRNAQKLSGLGFGIALQFSALEKDSLTSAIHEIVTNPKYSATAKTAGKILADNPIAPMDEALFWIEYVARYKGAPHLKSTAANMPLYRYFLLDVFGFFAFVAVMLGIVSFKLLNLICGGKKKLKIENVDKKKRNKSKVQ